MTSLGTLGGAWSQAFAINDQGQITGQAYLPGNVGAHPFLYANGTMKDIDTRNSTYSDGWGINKYGVVVGEMTVKCNCQFLTYHAFVYTGGKMQDLNKLIPAHSGWVLTQALGINDSGQIVGWGIRKNQTRGFLLNPK